MEEETSRELLTFNLEGENVPVSFLETMQVSEGVECDVYQFDNRKDVDLGIIKIQPKSKTPRQKILKGDKTIEGYILGKGKLIVEEDDGQTYTYEVDNGKVFEVTLGIGDIMQWYSDDNNELIVYELCYPPYEDGRYEDLE